MFELIIQRTTMAFAMAIVILVMGTNMLSSSTQASPVSLPSPGIDTSTDKQFISLIGKFISSIDKNILTRIRDTVGPLLAKVRQIFQIKVREDSHQIFKSERMEINGNKNDEQTSSSSSSSSSSNGASGNRISLFPQWLRPLIKR